jgi:hypothetical protein
MGRIIGIDLGTTNSVVAIMEGKEAKVIVNEEGDRITPSVVGFDEAGEVLVGQIAKRQAITNPENTIYSAKRFVGRRFEEVGEESKRVPYKVVRRENGDVGIDVRGKAMTPPEVSSHVLRKLKKAAENYLGESTSRRRPRSRTASTRRRTSSSRSTTSAAARSTCRSSRSATTSCRSSAPTATRTSAATTSTTA